jgi:hypothetical protein
MSKKKWNDQKIALLAATVSLAFHASVVSITIPSFFSDFANRAIQTASQISHDSSPVFYELVEQPIGEVAKTPSNTPFIDMANQRSKGRKLSQQGPGLPHLEGDSKAKIISERKKFETQPKELPNYFSEDKNGEPSFFFEKQRDAKSVNDPMRDRLFRSMGLDEVEEVGDPQMATQQNLMVPYLKKVKKKIFDSWYNLVRRQTSEFMGSRVVVVFSIQANGSISDLEVKTIEGNSLYRDFCLTAVKNSAPFDPLPVEIPKFLKKNSLPIQFTFFYE